MESCQFCDGPLMLLGALGTRVHYRCRACGWPNSEEVTPQELDDLGFGPDDDDLFEDNRRGAADLHELHDSDPEF